VNTFLSVTNKMQRVQYSLLLSVLYMFRAGFPLIIRSSKTVPAASVCVCVCVLVLCVFVLTVFLYCFIYSYFLGI
jgi:hypothetical protein